MAIPLITGKKIKLTSTDHWQEEISLFSGEIHYWRLEPASWRDVLQPVKELGLKMVSTYVCWDFHEYSRGCFDFNGKTNSRRNLNGFLELLAEQGFWIIIRPGPYIYSEWRNGGVPDYAARNHRLHPAFQEFAHTYMQAVVAALKPHFATNGGRILLFQADNEVDPWPHWYTEQLGLGNTPGPFQDFLHQRYDQISALNTAWGTVYETFEQARATMVMFPDQLDRMRRFLDYTRFQHWYTQQIAQWTLKTYRELGVDLPIFFNAYSGFSTQNWAELEGQADLAGPDLYPTSEFSRRPDEHRHFLEAIRYTRTYSQLPFIPELEAGIWPDWHSAVGVLGPNHYRLMCLSALLGGIAGWNWYMLVNRDNWYMSPINEWGRKRPDLFAAFHQIMGLVQALDPVSLEKCTATALTHDPLQRGTQRPGQELLQAVYQAGIDYEFYDVNRGACEKPLLFYAGGAWLSIAAQERLKTYMLNGGHLVCIGAFPRLDDQLQPGNILGIAEPDGTLSGVIENLRLSLEMGSSNEKFAIVESPWLNDYQDVPGDPIIAERLVSNRLTAEELTLQTNLQAGARYTIGYTQSYGQGRLTVIGLSPSPDLLLALHRHFKIPVYARSHTPGVLTALFERENEYFLIAVNNTEQALTADIRLTPEGPIHAPQQVEDLISGETWEIEQNDLRQVVFHLPRKDGTVLRLSGKESKP